MKCGVCCFFRLCQGSSEFEIFRGTVLGFLTEKNHTCTPPYFCWKNVYVYSGNVCLERTQEKATRNVGLLLGFGFYLPDMGSSSVGSKPRSALRLKDMIKGS